MRSAPTPSFRKTTLLAGAACLGWLSAGVVAAASDAKTDLPGVEGDFRIVKPRAEALEPEPDTLPPDGSLRVGDWDVRISGSVIVDIGTMKPRSGR